MKGLLKSSILMVRKSMATYRPRRIDMETTKQALINDTSAVRMLYMALELSAGKWQVAIAHGQRAPSRHTIAAGDRSALLQLVEKAKKRCGLQGAVRVLSCYEAGRDGFWLHRWLREQGIEKLVWEQMRALEQSRKAQLKTLSEGPLLALLKLRAIGLTSAWLLTRELFGWRRFGNRRELAGCVGLNPSPYDSGQSQREQGISKAGNRRVRALLVEIAWYWLRYQPHSALSEWFNRRFAAGGKRMRRIGIVALARRLLIALWRYVEHAVLPQGAQLKRS